MTRVHRQQALSSSVWQLPDGGDVVAAFAQSVGPTSDAPIIGDRIVPGAVTVHGQAGRQARTGRDADRGWVIGSGETAPACSKRVQRRCVDYRVTGMPGDLTMCSSDMRTSGFCGVAAIGAPSSYGLIVQPLPGSGSELLRLGRSVRIVGADIPRIRRRCGSRPTVSLEARNRA